MANMNFGVNILPKANNTYTLGNSDYKWNIFANSLNGVSLTNIINDVQINGTSILSNNIANIPIASWNTLGVVKANVDYGLGMLTEGNAGIIATMKAETSLIKAGTNIYKPIVPYNQHESVFYGLAKVAGDSTQSASSNTVGTYTDSAKTAIQNMLGIPYSNATTSTRGLMSVEDKIKLDSIQGEFENTDLRIESLAENGYYAVGSDPQTVYLTLTSGGINSSGTVFTDQQRGYIWLTSEQEQQTLNLDTSVYSYNICYMNGSSVAKYTSWITSSPITFDETTHTQIGIMVKKTSGGIITDNLSQILYYTTGSQETIGNLATKDYVENFNQKKMKCIYPDGFTSRIKPDIYFDGGYYADINTDDYKISGNSEIWVSVDGNDSTGDGTKINPYLTITKALTNSAVTIHIAEGTYSQGTHYNANVSFGGRNFIGHGTVTFENDSSGHSTVTTSSAYFENIIFKHGNTSLNPAFSAACSGSSQQVCFVGCTFRDAGNNGLSVTGMDAVLIGCIAYGNKLDGFNYHNKTISSVVYVPNVLEINCIAYNNGSSQSGSDSCNGSTAHDGVQIIRLNGEYYSCYGGVIAEIGGTNDGDPTTKSVNFGVLAHESTGTGTYCASFWASYNTEMYLQDCKSYGGTYDISAINDAKIITRGFRTGRSAPAINIASTAIVYQLDNEVSNKIDSSEKGSTNGVAALDSSGKVPSSQLPQMVGATSLANGSAGYVPAPATTDVNKFLAGDGTYKSGGLPMVILSYGNSTWNDFINAYNNNVIVYCRASSNSNPATGSQTRMAFMAYVNDASSPTNVEFQYYRSMNSHSATAMGDEVYIYKLTNASGGTWSVTTRPASIKEIKMATGSAGSVSWSSNVVTLDSGLPAVTASDDGKILKVVNGAWAVVDP